MLKHSNRAPADQQRDAPEDPETAVDHPPDERDASNLAGDERQRNDPCTGDETEGDDPFVAHRINKGTNERGGDSEMCKGEPIGAVSEKRIARAGGVQSNRHAIDPSGQPRRFENCLQHSEVNKRIEPIDFGLERKRRDAAEHESNDEDGEPETDEPKLIGVCHSGSHIVEPLAANSA